ncbi:MAG TPA: TPM domain-containing protein, partial [Albitalea sp.]
ALALFGKLRVWDTERNNGVLIYLLLAEHAIEIIADRGVARHVSAEEWQRIVGTMSDAFRAGRFEDGLNSAIDAVHERLVRHFPLQPGAANPNELTDAVVLL